MNIKELKEILAEVPADAEILLSVNGYEDFTDDAAHGPAQAYHLKLGTGNVFYLTNGNLEKKPEDLNYYEVKTIKHWDRRGVELMDDSGEPLYDDEFFKLVDKRIIDGINQTKK